VNYSNFHVHRNECPGTSNSWLKRDARNFISNEGERKEKKSKEKKCSTVIKKKMKGRKSWAW
jgi:hypothetical protein